MTSPTTVTVVPPLTIDAADPAPIDTTSPTGAPYTIPAPTNSSCDLEPCTVQVIVNGTVYNVTDIIQLPLGDTPITYVITDAAGKTAADTVIAHVNGPPSVTAPAPVTLNATSPAGASYSVQPPADQYCGHPQCTTQVLVNGVPTPYPNTVDLPIGTNNITYVITDALGQTSTAMTPVTVPSYLYVAFSSRT